MLPREGAAFQVEVMEGKSGNPGSPGALDRLAIVAAGNNVNPVAAAHEGLDPVPADSRLRALARFACVGGDEQLHGRTDTSPRKRRSKMSRDPTGNTKFIQNEFKWSSF